MTGDGTVSGTGISCGFGGSDCTQDFFDGTVVTLSESAESGWMFSGWGGHCDASGMVTMDDSLREFVTEELVEPLDALDKAIDKDAMRSWLSREGHDLPDDIEMPTGA